MKKQTIFFIISAVFIASLLGITYQLTAPLIQKQLLHKAEALSARLINTQQVVVKKESFELLAPAYLHMGDMQAATRIYETSGPSHIIIKTFAKGYNGNIALMVSLDKRCTIDGVEILSEHETPGLGDQYKKDSNTWIHAFVGKNIHNAIFSLRRDGGDFDAWSGATVTPKSIVKSLHEALNLCEKYHDTLFSAETEVYIEN